MTDVLIPISGRFEDGTHLLTVRVYYEDTDFSGIVYHANYLKYLERGRTDQLRLAGVQQSELLAKGKGNGGGIAFAVRRMTLDWLRPARMDDVLTVETRTTAVKGATIAIAQRILRGAEILVTADVTVAAIRAGRPTRIPESLRALLGG